jgi:hypothetical protein
MNVVKEIEEHGSKTGETDQNIIISDCGEIKVD